MANPVVWFRQTLVTLLAGPHEVMGADASKVVEFYGGLSTLRLIAGVTL